MTLLRTFLGWWHRLLTADASRTHLLGPDLLCEVVIHVQPSGGRAVYVSKVEGGQEAAQKVVQAVIGAGVELAQQSGIGINWPVLNQMYPYKGK